MSATNIDTIKNEIRGYITIFSALLILSFVTVGIFYLQLPLGFAIFFALLISAIQAFLAAGYFMHLISEKMLLLYAILALTVVFIIFAIALPSIEHHNPITGTIYQNEHHQPNISAEHHNVP
ncbi:MAG: cytochrome C oxidase subunit IV family protein [Candidatus Omnitrophica bacterium]|nr:cytochrome C oxidase subunit IV family protein [Candidatus Omnitrophota bacterium]